MGSTKRNALDDEKPSQTPRMTTHKSKRVKGATRGTPGPRSDAQNSLPTDGSGLSTSPPENRQSARRLQWPGLLRTHVGLLESHALTLQHLIKDMQSEAEKMSLNDRLDWELDEKGEWRLICRMMEDTRELLMQARKVARGILLKRQLHDHKGLDPEKTTFEHPEPQLQAKAEAHGYNPSRKNHSRMSSENELNSPVKESSIDKSALKAKNLATSESEIDDEMITNVDFISLKDHSKRSPRKKITREKTPIPETIQSSSDGVESNPYFMIDLNPTPVDLTHSQANTTRRPKSKVLDTNTVMDRKARLLERDRKKEAQKLSSPEKKEHPSEQDVDFAALQAQLLAEIAAGERYKRESLTRIAALNAGKESSKKRRRSSEGAEAHEKKAKKEKRKRKSNEPAICASDVDKKRRKKRKADDCILDEKEAGLTKKRRHKKD
ncbi:hypothetical protein K3495_g7677 [Podosphaera aphanis]|nr:hypothetical protein K3495_g7677 [Podosphaera aphanis]